MSEVRDAVAGLKLALDQIESELGKPEMSLNALENFKVMVDNVRTSVLAALTAAENIPNTKTKPSMMTKRFI